MRPDGSLELWDESYLPGFKEIAVSLNPKTGRPYRQRRDRGSRIQDLYAMIKEGLAAYQGYFVRHPYQPFRGWFQFARYLDRGDIINNLTTGDVYTVKDLIPEEDGSFLGQVLLSGGTSPRETDRLRLDPKNLIVCSHAHPRSEAATAKFEPNTDGTDQPSPFNDTIEWSQRRQEPGTVGKRPFDRERQALPILREANLDDSVDPNIATDIYGWWFDHLIQFDLFARDNTRLDGEAKLDGSGDPGLVNWFQDFMKRYRWVFLWNGIQQILEWQGTEDEPVGRAKNDMVHRPLLYYVRTERISAARVRRIARIDVLVNIGAPEDLVAQSGCPAPTGQIGITVNDLGLYNEMGG